MRPRPSRPKRPTTGANGWVAGAGIETGFGVNWTARVEYLRVDLGNATSVFPLAARQQNVSLQLDVVRFGMNYKFN